MKIDLLNVEAFTNAAFDQVHKTYVTLREERREALERVRNQALEEIKKELLKQLSWWKIRNFEGHFLGYGYGDAEAVANQFARHDYKNSYDDMWVEMINDGEKPRIICTEKPFKVNLLLSYDWNNPAFKNLEEELEKKGLVLPEIK